MEYLREHFLAETINTRGYLRVAELGVRGGRTLLHLLSHCPRTTVIGVDTWKHRPENAGREEEGLETYQNLNMSKLEHRVRSKSKVFGSRCILFKTDTSEAAKLIPDNSLDLVFIDADHSENGVLSDIDLYLPKVRDRGVISGHDINWNSVKTAVEKRFSEYFIGPDNVWMVEVRRI